MFASGASTEWEWGWGSGGGWLCGSADTWCDTCNITGHVDMAAVTGVNGMDDEPDCELGDTDVGADFGDFGF